MSRTKIISPIQTIHSWKQFLLQKVSILLIFASIPTLGHSQVKSIGTPDIQNYPKSIYKAGTQNWRISQDKNGFIYFANNDGVLRFDGLHWDLIEVSESAPIRSIAIDSQNRIFVGFFNDFGVLQQNETGPLSFQSMRHLLPDENIDFDDIWKIYEIPQGIVFQSFNYLFLLKGNQIEIIRPHNQFHFSFYVNDRFFLHEPGIGLFEYFNGIIGKVPWADRLKDTELLTILKIRENQLLIGTNNKGCYIYKNGKLNRWETPANHLIEKNKLFCATKILEDQFAFGTILGGVVISDLDGNIIQHINRDNGLQNNTVLTIYPDKDNNIWLGLDNGIDFIAINSPLSFISDFEGLGTGYCCAVFNGNLYLGTNQGLFTRSFNNESTINEPFKLVKNTAGQVWSLNEFDGQLICGHKSGTFLIQNREAKPITNEEGGWKYIRLHDHPDILLGGHYNGLVLLRRENDEWKFHQKIKGFKESSRFIHQAQDGSLWISHGGKGIFRVQLNYALDEVINSKLYTQSNGLPANNRNILIPFNEKWFISTIDGIYEYRDSSDTFEKNETLNQLLGLNSRLKTLKTDNSGNIWFIAQNESGVLRRNEDLTYTKITAPFKQLTGKFVNEFEFIYPLSNDHVFLGMDNGFAHYSSKIPKSYSKNFQSFITRVEIPNMDSTLYINAKNSTINPEIPFKRNAFRFHFTAPYFENLKQLQFSFFLDHYSEEWSEWSTNGYKDFTNLPGGEYIFRLKAKNIYDVESETSTFIFTILPPWYRTRWALYLYIILLGLAVWLTFKFIRFRIELSQKREKQKHDTALQKREEQFQHQALIAEKEIIRLRNEKLRNEMIHRDMELANQTMGIIRKNKFLIKLKDEIKKTLNTTEDSQVKTKLVILNRQLVKEIDNKQQNRLFETYFDEVHEEFFKKLKQKFPRLSPKEMRLCAYIRMNLSSKEIAALQNITSRGVEISRYRLRKKLKLSRDTNLSTFLSNI